MNIDLGKKSDSCAVPSPVNTSGDKVYYPSLYLEGSQDLKDIPESGTLTIRFKRVSQTSTERDGKSRYSLELEVREIVGAEGGDPETGKSAEDALDEIRKTLGGDDGE